MWKSEYLIIVILVVILYYTTTYNKESFCNDKPLNVWGQYHYYHDDMLPSISRYPEVQQGIKKPRNKHMVEKLTNSMSESELSETLSKMKSQESRPRHKSSHIIKSNDSNLSYALLLTVGLIAFLLYIE